MLLLLQVCTIYDIVVHHSAVLSPASLSIHHPPFVSFLVLQPALAALLQEFCSWKCTLLPFSSLAGHTVPCPQQRVQSMVLNFLCQRKILDPTWELYDCLVLQPFTMGKSPQHHILVCQFDCTRQEGQPWKSPSPFQKPLILWYEGGLLGFSFLIINIEKDPAAITDSSDCLSRWSLCFLVRPSERINPALAILRICRYFQI